jgi:hypothetical protein
METGSHATSSRPSGPAWCCAKLRASTFNPFSGSYPALEAPASNAQEALDLILELYPVEHEAEEQRIVGTAAHRTSQTACWSGARATPAMAR